MPVIHQLASFVSPKFLDNSCVYVKIKSIQGREKMRCLLTTPCLHLVLSSYPYTGFSAISWLSKKDTAVPLTFVLLHSSQGHLIIHQILFCNSIGRAFLNFPFMKVWALVDRHFHLCFVVLHLISKAKKNGYNMIVEGESHGNMSRSHFTSNHLFK